jgi:hypothetical protein
MKKLPEPRSAALEATMFSGGRHLDLHSLSGGTHERTNCP